MRHKTEDRLRQDAILTAFVWLVLMILVGLQWGIAALLVFVIGSILSWICGSVCTWLAALFGAQQ